MTAENGKTKIFCWGNDIPHLILLKLLRLTLTKNYRPLIKPNKFQYLKKTESWERRSFPDTFSMHTEILREKIREKMLDGNMESPDKKV